MLLHADTVCLPDGWSRRVLIETDDDGIITSVRSGVRSTPGNAERVSGTVLPGIPDVHSNAFQRALVGAVERRGVRESTFQTWRARMFDLAALVGPGELEAITAQVHVELLKGGYTAVGEFHTLHLAPDGKPYDDPAELPERCIAGAGRAGIAITHLPVLSVVGGFGQEAPERGQRRFVLAPETYLEMVEELARRHHGQNGVHIGVAAHSLAAVPPEALRELSAWAARRDPPAPVHVQVAEQLREVEECLLWCGARPVQWLLDNISHGENWCLLHATHVTAEETQAMARGGLVVGLCPSTGANLGDGIFPANEFLILGGTFGVGSAAGVSRRAVTELRMLEYGQRLQHHVRAMLASRRQPSVGARLYRDAAAGGARALGLNAGSVEPGRRADLVVIDDQAPCLNGRHEDGLIDAWVFGCDDNPVRHVMVGGRWVIRDGRHAQEEPILEDYRRVITTLSKF